MSTSLIIIPLFVIGATSDDRAEVNEIEWGISSTVFEEKYAGYISNVGKKESHSYRNSFGVPLFKFHGSLSGHEGVVYVRFSYEDQKRLVSLLWNSGNQVKCERLFKDLKEKLGAPTSEFKPVNSFMWTIPENDLEINLKNWTDSCNVSLSPVDPYTYSGF